MTARVPTALKILTGNRGKRKLPQDEPQPGPPTSPEPPAYLGPEARAFWRREFGPLADSGILRAIDQTTFAAYADAAGDFERYSLALQAKGGDGTITTLAGNVIQDPLVGMKRRARGDLQRLAACFGMTPTSRVGMQVLPPAVAKPARASSGVDYFARPDSTDRFFTR